MLFLGNKITLITSAQVSANPRLLKEAIYLVRAGFEVKVIWCPISPWADCFDQKLFAKVQNILWLKAGYHAERQPIGYYYARMRKKIWQLFYKIVGNQFDAAIKSLVLYSQELTSLALEHNADIYIGHNLGALPAIVKAAKKYKAKSIFDFEDFHRGEAADGTRQARLVQEIENQYILLVDFLTTASPAITDAYQQIFQSKKIATINNCFSLEYSIQNIKSITQKPLKLFWFSQYLGMQRGLESVFKAMSNFRQDAITLTLLGSASSSVKQYFIDLMKFYNLSCDQLVFLDPVSEEQIVSIASMHHIGLASEFAYNQNRNLCLTNKLFMYLLAGNALVVSDTYAQKLFLSDNPGIGSLYKQENDFDLSCVLNIYIDNPNLLETHRKNALDLGKTKYNWDTESKQFMQIVEQLLAS